jgi:hypothetical protein
LRLASQREKEEFGARGRKRRGRRKRKKEKGRRKKRKKEKGEEEEEEGAVLGPSTLTLLRSSRHCRWPSLLPFLSPRYALPL